MPAPTLREALLINCLPLEENTTNNSSRFDFTRLAKLAHVAAAVTVPIVTKVRDLQPDLVVSLPDVTWLGKEVSLATNIDHLPLTIDRNTGRMNAKLALLRAFAQKEKVVILAGEIDQAAVQTKQSSLPSYIGDRAIALVGIWNRTDPRCTLFESFPVHALFAEFRSPGQEEFFVGQQTGGLVMAQVP